MAARERAPRGATTAGALEHDRARCDIRCNGRSIRLKLIEYRLLAALLAAAGEPVTYRMIAEDAFGWLEYDALRLPNLLAVVVRRVNRKLSDVRAASQIQAVAEVGYCLR